MVQPYSDRVSPAPPYSYHIYITFMYRAFTSYGWPFQIYSINYIYTFGLVRFRSPLLAESLIILLSYRYLDVSVPCVRFPYGMYSLQLYGLPHSDTCGSIVVCTSPQIFAAYHVLRRLREPRHPPCALIRFLFFSLVKYTLTKPKECLCLQFPLQ